MRKIVLLFVVLITSVFADVKYVDIFDAYDKAQAENKIVMVMLSQQGCSGCEYMEEIVFNNKDVVKSLKNNFVVVHVDVYKDGIPDGLEFFATPTFYFLDADENVLKRMNGGENAKDFAKTLQSIKKK